MFLTAWCIALALLGPLALGLPVRWLLGGRRPLDEVAWVQAPFLGIGAIVLPLQAFVYLDVPVKYSFVGVWALALLLWAWLARSGQVRDSLRQCPHALLATVLAVYLVHGIGLVLVGTTHYVGRGWMDQYGYTAVAQFLHDLPFSTSMDQVDRQPFLFTALAPYPNGDVLKHDRIGAMIFQAFFAASSGGCAKTVFEPTILLCPALTVLAVYGLGRRFGMPSAVALATGATAGLLPSLTMLHLESFLSHALGTPFLLFLPALLAELEERGTWPALLTSAVVLATGVALYTELTPIFEVLVGACFAFSCLGKRRSWGRAGECLLLAASPLLLNPLSARTVWQIMMRLTRMPPSLEEHYPWALTLEGLVRIWFGDLTTGPKWRGALWPCGVLATAIGCYALARRSLHGLFAPSEEAETSPGSPAFCACVLALFLVPLGIVAKDVKHPYQFYKVLISVSPLLVLGLGFLVVPTVGGLAGRWRLLRFGVVVPLFALVSSGVALSTISMVLRTADAAPAPRSYVHLQLAPENRALADRLQSLRGRNVFYASENVYSGYWVTYYARHNKLYAIDPQPPFAVPYDPGPLPPDCLYLTRLDYPTLLPPNWLDERRVEWRSGPYVLWTPLHDDWAYLAHVVNPNGYDRPAPADFLWLGGPETTLRVLAGRSGGLRIRATCEPGPSLPGVAERTILLKGEEGFSSRVVVREGPHDFLVPVKRGLNRISLQALDAPTLPRLPSGEARPLLLGVKDLSLALVPKPTPAPSAAQAAAPSGPSGGGPQDP